MSLFSAFPACARRLVDEPNAGVGAILLLATGAASAEGLHLKIGFRDGEKQFLLWHKRGNGPPRNLVSQARRRPGAIGVVETLPLNLITKHLPCANRSVIIELRCGLLTHI